MEKNAAKFSGAEPVQVFEVTMDNPQDQDELNRRLRKPGEGAWIAPTLPETTSPPESQAPTTNRD